MFPKCQKADSHSGPYCINDRSGLKVNDDGSVDVILSKTAPEDTTNWLPIGDGGFHLYMRIYTPDMDALKTWTAPIITEGSAPHTNSSNDENLAETNTSELIAFTWSQSHSNADRCFSISFGEAEYDTAIPKHKENNNLSYLPIYADRPSDAIYCALFSTLPRYYVEGNTIFVHAGIDEEAGGMWELGTAEEIFTSKYPAETGKIEGINMKVVAGHIGTAVISGDKSFHDIYFDGESHYYIDGTVLESGVIPVLMVDTEDDKEDAIINTDMICRIAKT